MGNQFLSSLEVMTSRSQCPTVLLDAETVRRNFMLSCVVQTGTVMAVMCMVFCLTVVAGLLWPVGDSEV